MVVVDVVIAAAAWMSRIAVLRIAGKANEVVDGPRV
jgi:hypothetical protein